MRILAFQNALDIAAELEGIGSVAQIEERVFPDGELLVRVPEVEGTVVVVARMYPGVNENLVKLLLTIDALNDAGAAKIILIIPYMPYARQDRRFRPGEPISSKTILRLLAGLNVSSIITVDLHKSYIAEYAPRLVINNLYPAQEFAKALGSVDVILSPDFGSIHRAEAVARLMHVPYTYFEKYRDRNTGAITLVPRQDLDLRNKRVAVVDDILSTGGTLVDACKAAKTLGASEVYAAVTHCQLLKDARERVKSCIDRIICTDTILNEFAQVRVGQLIRGALASLL